jgi:hypothetical protein
MKKLIFVLFAVTALLVSCSKEDAPTFTNEDGIVLNNNSAELSKYIKIINEPLVLKGGLKSGPIFTLVAEAESPTINGIKTSASYVHRRYQKVYVTYHIRGTEYGGAIRVFDISDPVNPIIVSEMDFARIDINACDINEGGSALYLAGSHKAKGAVVLKLAIDANGIITSTPADVILLKVGDAFSANGIIQGDDFIHVSAGNSVGGVYVYNRTSLIYSNSDLYSGAKFVAANGRTTGKNLVSLEVNATTNDANLHVYTIGTFDPSTELIWPVGSISHQNVEPENTDYGKATLFMRPDATTCYVSLGMNGMKAFDITNGNLVYESPMGMITYGNTNAVSADANYIYMANGAQGLYIAQPPVSGTEVEIIGIWDEEKYPGSANHVYSDGSYIFLAKGVEGGLKIIKQE